MAEALDRIMLCLYYCSRFFVCHKALTLALVWLFFLSNFPFTFVTSQAQKGGKQKDYENYLIDNRPQFVIPGKARIFIFQRWNKNPSLYTAWRLLWQAALYSSMGNTPSPSQKTTCGFACCNDSLSSWLHISAADAALWLAG